MQVEITQAIMPYRPGYEQDPQDLEAQTEKLKAAGVTRVGVGLDCATEETFSKIKPGFNWTQYHAFLDEIVEVCRKEIDQKGLGFDCLAVGSDMAFEL